jgi:hypothetical protein
LRANRDAGYALILESYEHHVRQSMFSGTASVLGFAAEVQILAQRWSLAQQPVDEALALAQRIGERIFLPDLRLYRAQIALGRGDVKAARASMRESVSEARAQQALWLEASALVALCELDDAAPEDLDELLAMGAQEIWFIFPERREVEFYGPEGKRGASQFGVDLTEFWSSY